ncbi:MAG: serine/threonine protein kinase [Pirellulaceae bacterium]|nr:serine/threonine protein kinase [Pirellulaceae bacterium]
MDSTPESARSDCPSDAILSAFNGGRMTDPAVEEAVAQHLGSCPTCESRLATLGQDSDSIAAILVAPDPMREFADGTRDSHLLSPTRTVAALDQQPGPAAGTVELPLLPEKIGKYFVLQEIGSGGFGRVYKAKDPDTHRIVAIKVPRLYSSGRIAEFLREARTAAQLTHDSIVQVYDWGRAGDGLCYVVMEYMEGGSLKELLKSVIGARQRAVEVVVAVAEALRYAHGQGVYHRDVKPANILFDARGVPHLADFGLAIRDDQRWDHQGDSSGTDAYMAPEQVRGNSYQFDGRTDIWSLGVVFYEMLTGGRPFSAANRERLFVEILNREPRAPHAASEAVSLALSDICLKCLRKEIGQRYASCADLLQALEVVLRSGGDEAAGAVAVADPARRESRTNRSKPRLAWPAAMLAGVLLLAAVTSLAAVLEWPLALLPARPLRPTDVGQATDIDQERLEAVPVPFRWYPLLQRPPTALFPPDLPAERVIYNEQLSEVIMQSPSFSHVILGQAASGKYRFQVDITKIAPQGASGIIFGLRPELNEAGIVTWHGQIIRLTCRQDDYHTVRRELIELVPVPQANTYGVNKRSLASVRVPTARIRGDTLEITVDPGRVSEVRWRGQLLPELCDTIPNPPGGIPNCQGKLGLVNSDGSVTFQNARYMSLKGVSP